MDNHHPWLLSPTQICLVISLKEVDLIYSHLHDIWDWYWHVRNEKLRYHCCCPKWLLKPKLHNSRMLLQGNAHTSVVLHCQHRKLACPWLLFPKSFPSVNLHTSLGTHRNWLSFICLCVFCLSKFQKETTHSSFFYFPILLTILSCST